MIKVTQRMLNKSIIDANKAVTSFVEDNLPYGYDGMQGKMHYPAHIGRPNDWMDSELRIYKRPRGDKLLSIKNLSKVAKAGDVLTLETSDGVTVYITVTKLEDV